MSGDPRPGLPRSIGVIGGGTAGHFAALALKKRFPDIEVTIVESSAVPIIGVGEATTTLMPPFLHGQLGLDVVELYEKVRPSFKLGIKFEWGLPGDYYFTYPFGAADPIEAHAFDHDLRAQSLLSLFMAADRAPIVRGPDGELLSLLTQLKFAYHLNNAPFVDYLATASVRAGIRTIDMTIERVALREDGGVRAVVGGDGRELCFDFFVDATGFRSLLIEKALGSPFQSYASSLFCDRAIVARAPQRGTIEPYTTAETMECGWCWRIPVDGEDHRGYVHSSAFLSEDAALAEMQAKNPGLGEPWVVRFRSGRHREFWCKNTVAVGNAYGFVEPLESTALHMVIIELGYLLAGLEAMADPAGDRNFPRFASDSVGAHWDYLRWFLSAHYKFNQRVDNPFWRAIRADVDVTGLEPALERFRATGPWLDADGRHHDHDDPSFSFSGLMMILLGQHVPGPVTPRAGFTREAWVERVDKQRRVVARGLPQDEAIRVLLANPAMLRQFAEQPSSWVQGEAERVRVSPRGQRRVSPGRGGPGARSLSSRARQKGQNPR
jgi:tryptophan halogenase